MLTQKLYNEKAIAIGTALGGPLVAGYLLSENFKIFKEEDKVSWVWFYSICATILLFGIVLSMPLTVLNKLPQPTFHILTSCIATYFFKRTQGGKVSQYIQNGGQAHSLWRVSGIGIIFTIITVAPLFLYFNSAPVQMKNVASKLYGASSNMISYEPRNISE